MKEKKKTGKNKLQAYFFGFEALNKAEQKSCSSKLIATKHIKREKTCFIILANHVWDNGKCS